jgi:hypothetical protein
MIRLVAACVLVAGASGAVLVEGGRRAPEPDLLRGYAFATCIATAYRGTPFEKDALHVAELYREAGHEARQAVYEALSTAAQKVEAPKPATKDAANLALMRCLEFYESAPLRKLARPKPSK